MIHVNRGTTSLGVFSEQEVREGLSAGRFTPTDIGWREGMPVGSRSRSSQSSEGPLRLPFRLYNLAQLRRQHLSRGGPVCRGSTGKSAGFSTRSSRRSQWCLLVRRKHSV